MSKKQRSYRLAPFDFVRGFLIGLVELVPGVSGGTVALVTGVYDDLIQSAAHGLKALKHVAFGPDRSAGFKEEMSLVSWRLLIPVILGMVTAVFSIAGLMGSFVENNTELARGLFFGLVITSLLVPFQMIRDTPIKPAGFVLVGVFVLFTLIAWLLVGLANGSSIGNPSWIVIMITAAIAVCALVIPGVSGSFFLLAVGLYATTMNAVHNRDWGYLGIFMVGAVIGLASFVQLLQFLLRRFRAVTLTAMAGLMLGSVRALWPWQESPGEDPTAPGALIGPYEPVGGPILLMLVGAALVLVLLLVESTLKKRAKLLAQSD